MLRGRSKLALASRRARSAATRRCLHISFGERMRKPCSWASTLEGRDDFPAVVADTLVVLAAGDAAGYDRTIRALVADFEARSEFLEDTPVADTVLALQVLAEERSLAVELASPLLPA